VKKEQAIPRVDVTSVFVCKRLADNIYLI